MYEKLEACLNEMPQKLAQSLRPIVLDDTFEAMFSAEQFDQILAETQMDDAELRLALLPLAACYAITPISHFNVGAIARGLSGNIYFGANMEMNGVQLNQTIHAEQSSIAHAWVCGEKGLKDITINYTPCGHCRQFMKELSTADDLSIQLPENDPHALAHYLPNAFGPGDLGIEVRLMAERNNRLKISDFSPLVTEASIAANKSYAPHSNSPAGIALKTVDGRIFSGMYAENAAFNPSLPALQVALVNLVMAGYKFYEIREAALVECKGAASSNIEATEATLLAINKDVYLEYVQV